MTTEDEVLNFIRKCLKDLYLDGAVLDNESFTKQGVDSLDQVELIMKVEVEYKMNIRDEDIEDGLVDTPKKLAEYVTKRKQNG